MNVILLLARLILALVFGIAGIAKLADPSGSKKSIAGFGVPESLAIPLTWLLPLAELACAAALIPLVSAWLGAMGVLILLLGFIAGISISLMRGRKPDCHCFGQMHSEPIGWKTLVRNIVLAGVSALVLWQGRENAGASVLQLAGGTQIAIAGLAAFELWALVHVLRQNGRLLLRLEAVEARVAADPQVQAAPAGLPVGSVAPACGVDLQALKPLILLFTEPGCGACDAAKPEIAQWQREHSDRLLIVPLQTNKEVSQAYKVEGTPSAVLVREGRIESPLAAGIDAIRGLVVDATLPAPVKQGDVVPSLELRDLSGKPFDLAKLQSRRTLMLFWSPSCGYCQQMLGDLKKWEDSPRPGAPDLVVIAAGAAEENRNQGFRARVLLDPRYAVSRVFNSGGTPSAVMVDQGMVASGVAVGAQAVLDLLG